VSKAGEQPNYIRDGRRKTAALTVVTERANTYKYRQECRKLAAQVRRLQQNVEVQAQLLREQA
jgi:hypothetical protein